MLLSSSLAHRVLQLQLVQSTDELIMLACVGSNLHALRTGIAEVPKNDSACTFKVTVTITKGCKRRRDGGVTYTAYCQTIS